MPYAISESSLNGAVMGLACHLYDTGYREKDKIVSSCPYLIEILNPINSAVFCAFEEFNPFRVMLHFSKSFSYLGRPATCSATSTSPPSGEALNLFCSHMPNMWERVCVCMLKWCVLCEAERKSVNLHIPSISMPATTAGRLHRELANYLQFPDISHDLYCPTSLGGSVGNLMMKEIKDNSLDMLEGTTRAGFVEASIRYASKQSGIGDPLTRYHRRVIVPILMAKKEFEEGRKQEALRHAMSVKAPDWRHACCMYLEQFDK